MYVGASGVCRVEDVELLDLIASRVPAWARVAAGVLVSGHGTMRREAELGARYPEASKVAEIVARSRRAAPFIHYNSRLDEPLSGQLLSVVRAFPELKGIQVNMASPDPKELAEFKARRPDVELVVQVRHRDAADAAGFIDRYVGVADHALLDCSLGTGSAADFELCSWVVMTHGRRWLDAGVRLGIAGGLGPWSGPSIRLLEREVADCGMARELSWDAETGLRYPDQTALSQERCAGYVSAVLRLPCDWLVSPRTESAPCVAGDAAPARTLPAGDDRADDLGPRGGGR